MRLIARRLSYRYSGESPWIFENAHLEISAGERVAVIGPSGSGKTTALALMGGLLAPDTGEVGVELSDQPSARRAVAGDHSRVLHQSRRYVSWVFQTTNILPDRDALHNASLGALAEGEPLPRAQFRGRQALNSVGLTSRAPALARTLSGGELQRVSIARALASSRPFILADEPTGQLDRHTTSAVLDVLFAPDHERAVLVVTHDEEVAARCQRVLAVHEQQLVPLNRLS